VPTSRGTTQNWQGEACKLPQEAKHLEWLDLNTEAGQEYWLAMNLEEIMHRHVIIKYMNVWRLACAKLRFAMIETITTLHGKKKCKWK